MASGPYSRIYHLILDDPEFDEVMHNDAALGLWVRLLITADQCWPQSAPKPANWRRSASYSLLSRTGLVQDLSATRYRVKGMDKERTLRSNAARNAAAVRWHGVRNAEPMPRREEKSKEETSSLNAPTSFIRFVPKDDPTDAKLVADLRRLAASKDELVAKKLRARLERMGVTIEEAQ